MTDKIHKLDSSIIDYVHDRIEEGEGIIVYMKSGEIYVIPDASPALLFDFIRAESPGQFFNVVIKLNFDIKKIEKTWLFAGVAIENIATGDRVEFSPETGVVRKMKLEKIT